MDTKMIAKSVKIIEVKERLSKKLVKFLMSDKGKQMVPMIGYMPLPTLIRKYEAPPLNKAGSSSRQMNILMHAVAKAGVGNLLRHTKLIDYTGLSSDEKAYNIKRENFVKDYQKNKSPIRLLKYEHKILNKKDEWEIKRLQNGAYEIKKEPDNNPDNISGHRLLFDKESGIPIFKWKRKPNPMGIAWKLHAYELHKMAKYDKKMAIKEEIDKKSDLFPDQIVAKYKMLREAHLEQVRKDLSDLYCPVTVHAMVIDRKNDDAKKVKMMSIKLGKTRSDTLDCRNKIKGDLKERLNFVMNAAKKEYPGKDISCLHLGSHNPKRSIIVMPHMLSIAA